jgi:hypothetical protein
MSTTSRGAPHDSDRDEGDRPSFTRVEQFLDGIERGHRAARRTRWVSLAVGAVIGGVAFLTAIGVVPVAAENLVLSASAVVAGLALTNASASTDAKDRTDQL